jgi:hypothetical protein
MGTGTGTSLPVACLMIDQSGINELDVMQLEAPAVKKNGSCRFTAPCCISQFFFWSDLWGALSLIVLVGCLDCDWRGTSFDCMYSNMLPWFDVIYYAYIWQHPPPLLSFSIPLTLCHFAFFVLCTRTSIFSVFCFLIPVVFFTRSPPYSPLSQPPNSYGLN